jgi:hypothetical protein
MRSESWPHSSYRSIISEDPRAVLSVVDPKSVEAFVPLPQPHPNGVSGALVLVQMLQIEPVIATGLDQDLVRLPCRIEVKAGYLAADGSDLGDYARENSGRWRCLLPTPGDNESDQ